MLAPATVRRENVAFTVVVTLLTVLGSLGVILAVILSGAPRIMVLAMVLAALPVGPLVACYLWLDRYEPEPKRLLAAGLAWGAFAATSIALVLEGIGGFVVGNDTTLTLAVIAPISEEATKGFFLLMLLWWRRSELDGILDGIVYAGMVGIGFAFVENILYLAAAYNGTDAFGPGGAQALTATFVLRCLIGPFAHPLFTAFTGIGVGIAVGSRSRLVRFLAPVAGYCVAVIAHGLWNGSALGGIQRFAGAYVVLMLPAFLGLIALAVWARKSERKMLSAALADAAARGLLPASDIPWLVDLGSRRKARAWAKQQGGDEALAAMKSYQQLGVELGFLHHRFLRGTPPPDFAARGQDFVQLISLTRPRISFPGQVVPTR